jgi:hypothetical protein
MVRVKDYWRLRLPAPALIALLLANAPVAIAQESDRVDYWSERYGFGIQMPPEWVAIPDSLLPQMYEFGMQQAGASEWFSHPYALVQAGEHAYVSASEWLAEAPAAMASNLAQLAGSEYSIGAPVVYEDDRLIMLPFQTTSFRGLSAYHLAEDGRTTITLHLYDRTNVTERQMRLSASVFFEWRIVAGPGDRYERAREALGELGQERRERRAEPWWRKAAIGFLAGGILVGGAAAFGWLISLSGKKEQSKKRRLRWFKRDLERNPPVSTARRPGTMPADQRQRSLEWLTKSIRSGVVQLEPLRTAPEPTLAGEATARRRGVGMHIKRMLGLIGGSMLVFPSLYWAPGRAFAIGGVVGALVGYGVAYSRRREFELWHACVAGMLGGAAVGLAYGILEGMAAREVTGSIAFGVGAGLFPGAGTALVLGRGRYSSTGRAEQSVVMREAGPADSVVRRWVHHVWSRRRPLVGAWVIGTAIYLLAFFPWGRCGDSGCRTEARSSVAARPIIEHRFPSGKTITIPAGGRRTGPAALELGLWTVILVGAGMALYSSKPGELSREPSPERGQQKPLSPKEWKSALRWLARDIQRNPPKTVSSRGATDEVDSGSGSTEAASDRRVFSRKGRNIKASPKPADPTEYAIVDPGPEYLGVDDRSLTAPYHGKSGRGVLSTKGRKITPNPDSKDRILDGSTPDWDPEPEGSETPK